MTMAMMTTITTTKMTTTQSKSRGAELVPLAIFLPHGRLVFVFVFQAHRGAKRNRVEGLQVFLAYLRAKSNRVGVRTRKTQPAPHEHEKTTTEPFYGCSNFVRTECCENSLKTRPAAVQKVTELGFSSFVTSDLCGKRDVAKSPLQKSNCIILKHASCQIAA